MEYLSDIEIARAVEAAPIGEVAAAIGLSECDLEYYGKYKAKIDLNVLERLSEKPDGKLILVTAINPTPAGEGKTTVSIGLADGLSRLGKNAILTLREPSLGPIFGIKGGATGGGRAQVTPMEDINLHFTGDFHAVSSANNLLAAIVDNHIYRGNKLDVDPASVTWRRCIDQNDRQLRSIVSGLSGKANGVPREDGFEITAASEIMAILCLSQNISQMKEKLGRIIIGRTRDGAPVTAGGLKAQGALAALLKDALKPNIVQTLERTPAFIHGGPFANIAHGCNSIAATKLALKLADYVVTEAGFGADLGAEKFCDIKCRAGGITPSACVVVVTVRALKHHGGYKTRPKQGLTPDNDGMKALERGMPNLIRHINNMQNVFNLPVAVAVNRFTDDTPEELALIRDMCRETGVKAANAEVWAKGGEGAAELAENVLGISGTGGRCGGSGVGGEGGGCGGSVAQSPPRFSYAYDIKLPILKKIETIAERIYGADGVEYDPDARKEAAALEKQGFGEMPICVAKTQFSFSDNPKKIGVPAGFKINVKKIKAMAGAGFIVAQTGDIMTLPGLPATPSAEFIDIDGNGAITGIF